MKSIDLQVRLIDLAARINSIELVLFSYLKVKEHPQAYSLLRKNFQNCYLESIEKQANLLLSENDALAGLTFLKKMFAAEQIDRENYE